jgi:hypothetical protein
MSAPKPFASLGPTLLARKGGARPAMRPQLVPMSALAGAQATEAIAHDLEDLGWNDMGTHEAGTPGLVHEAQRLSLTPAPANPLDEAATRQSDAAAHAEMAAMSSPAVPEVLRQRRAAAAEVTARASAQTPLRASRAAGMAPATDTGQRGRRNALEAGRRAAFTLRLDAHRHLMLRLASTVKNRSAQQLVTAALDQYLADIPEIETLAAQVKRDRHDR